MRKMIITLTLVAGLFVGATMSAGAEGVDPQSVVLDTPGHEQQHGDDARAAGDGICNAYYNIGGIHGYGPR